MAKDRTIWQVYLTDKDKEVAIELAKYYYIEKPTQALKMALRHELERFRFMELEEKKQEETKE